MGGGGRAGEEGIMTFMGHLGFPRGHDGSVFVERSFLGSSLGSHDVMEPVGRTCYCNGFREKAG